MASLRAPCAPAAEGALPHRAGKKRTLRAGDGHGARSDAIHPLHDFFHTLSKIETVDVRLVEDERLAEDDAVAFDLQFAEPAGVVFGRAGFELAGREG